MVGEKVKAGTAQMGDRVRNRLDRVRAQVDVGRRRAVDVVEEYPLMIGVCALAVGVVVGLSIPTGRKERRLIGQRASQLTGRVRDTARDIFERGKEVAETTFESVKDEARRQGLTGSCIKDTALESMDDLTERLEAVAETGKETLKDELHGETQRIERDLGVSKTDRNEGGSI